VSDLEVFRLAKAVLPIARPVREVTLDFDTHCVSCGYNVRGLAPGHHCPECGIPVGASLRGELLQFANPRWVSRLHLGAALACWGGLAILLHMTLGCMRVVQSTTFFYALWGIATGLFIVGLAILGSPSLRETPETPGRWVRHVARFGFLLVIATGMPGWFWPSAQQWVGLSVSLLGWGVYLGWIIVLLRYLRSLDRLFSAPALHRMPYYCIGAGALNCWLVLMYLVLWAATLPPTGRDGSSAAIPAGVSALLWMCYWVELSARFVVTLLLLACLNRCRKRLRQEAKLAEQNWLPPGTQVAPIGHGDLS